MGNVVAPAPCCCQEEEGDVKGEVISGIPTEMFEAPPGVKVSRLFGARVLRRRMLRSHLQDSALISELRLDRSLQPGDIRRAG